VEDARSLCLVDQLDLLLFGVEDTGQALAIRDIEKYI
jgi:hypothetical protein